MGAGQVTRVQPQVARSRTVADLKDGRVKQSQWWRLVEDVLAAGAQHQRLVVHPDGLPVDGL